MCVHLAEFRLTCDGRSNLMPRHNKRRRISTRCSPELRTAVADAQRHGSWRGGGGARRSDTDGWRSCLNWEVHIVLNISSNTAWQSDTQQCIGSKISGYHGGDYEECPLLGYKNPVRTSQETHSFSATEPSRLMLCKI
jgi:hypothetical protein